MKLRRFWLAFAAIALVAVAAGSVGAAYAAHHRSSHRTRHHRARRVSRNAIRFGHAVVVDHQRVDGEPSLAVSPAPNTRGSHDVYVSAPYGFSTTASFLWKSEDGGQTFHLVGDEAPAALGKPTMTCAGGGDSSIVTDRAGHLYFADLQGLTNVSDSVSVDGGNTFVSTCNSANDAGVDRPWLAVYGNPLDGGREYMTVDQVAQCDPDHCGLGQTGSNMLELTQASGVGALTQTFSPLPAQQIEPDGIVGGIVADQRNGALYVIHTALTNGKGRLTGGGDANANTNAIVVDRFPHGYSQTVPTRIPDGTISLCKPYNKSGPCTSETVVHSPLNKAGNSTVNNGQDFATIAIDRAGDLYVVWAQSPVNASGNVAGPTTVYLATSANGGRTWTKPIDVSRHVKGLHTNVFPWVAAGSRGRVDVAWYGTRTLGKCPGEPCGAGFVNGTWNVYLAQSLNAVGRSGKANPKPRFSTAKVTEYPNHYGQICEFGIACTTGGDRGLVDFIQVQAMPDGAAGIVWADGANTDFNGGETSPLIDFAVQTHGPGLYGRAVSGPAPRYGSAPGSPASYYAANGSEAAAGGNMRILASSVAKSGTNYVVTMRVSSLASLMPALGLGGIDAVWLTRWEVPASRPTAAVQGHVFYAAMESDLGGLPSFYVGQTACGIQSTHCKTLGYPSQHAVRGTYTAKGLIRLVVPMKLVGGNHRLYSVTGLTGTENTPGSTAMSVFNVIDSTAPYDVR